MMYVCKRRDTFSCYFYISSDVPTYIHALMNFGDEPYFRAKGAKVYLSERTVATIISIAALCCLNLE